MYVSKLTIIGSDNGLSPGQRQAIIRTNAEILLIGPYNNYNNPTTNFSAISNGIHIFSSKKCIWKCRLRIGVHFVSALICRVDGEYGVDAHTSHQCPLVLTWINFNTSMDK